MSHDPQPTATAPTAIGGRMQASTRSTLLGAMFLMATSAIGPGFITQTTAFTVQLGAAFAFAIAVSIVIDIALQLNVWRVIGVSGRRAQELGNLVVPGLGWVMPPSCWSAGWSSTSATSAVRGSAPTRCSAWTRRSAGRSRR